MRLRIDAIEMRLVRMRLKDPFETSFGSLTDRMRDCLLLRAEAGGIVGWGECVAGKEPGYSYETTGTAWHALSEFFIPAVLKEPILGIEDFCVRTAAYKGHPMARAGLEMALWDLTGKRDEKSLKSMLGGQRESVPVGVSVGLQPDVESLLRTVARHLEEGYRRIKLKIKPGRDVAPVSAVRQAHPDLDLQVDANSAYTFEDASVFHQMDDLGLVLIEQPLAEDDLVDHSRLQASLRTPLCLDESITSARHARQAYEITACRIINIKPARVGGLSEALRIHDYCRSVGVPVWCGGMLETGIGRASNLALASLPGFKLPGDISASDRYYELDIIKRPFSLNEDSTIDVPDLVGLGVEVDMGALDQVTVRKKRYAV